MAIKTWCQVGFITAGLLLSGVSVASSLAESDFIEIDTYLHDIDGRPIWTLILRDMTSGQVLPYLFDLRKHDNHWIAFSLSHTYRVIASRVQFDNNQEVNNFCNLEDGILRSESMTVTITGSFSPDLQGVDCQIQKYKTYPLPITGTD